jgi:hypothetical protein
MQPKNVQDFYCGASVCAGSPKVIGVTWSMMW